MPYLSLENSCMYFMCHIYVFLCVYFWWDLNRLQLYLTYLHHDLSRVVQSVNKTLLVIRKALAYVLSHSFTFCLCVCFSFLTGKKETVAIVRILPFRFVSEKVKDVNALICRNSIGTIDLILIYYKSIQWEVNLHLFLGLKCVQIHSACY